MLPFRPLFGFLILILFIASCSGETAEYAPEIDLSGLSFAERVEFYLQNEQFEDAFDELADADPENAELRDLQLAAHLTYAIYLTYSHVSPDVMRTRMPEALRHYRRVLQLDPNNARARAEIEQIEGIYRSLNREVPQGVAE